MENIKFISAKAIIAKLYSDYNLQLEVRIADIMEWVGEATEWIGSSLQYVDKVIEKEVHDHRVYLPCDLVHIKQVLLNNKVINYSNHTILMTIQDEDDPKRNTYNTRESTYNIQNNCLLISSKRDAKVRIYYLGLNTDEEGFPMIVDNLRYIEAVIAYIMFKVKNAELFSGRITPQEAEYYRVNWEKGRVRAGSYLSMPSPEQAYSIGLQFQRLIPFISSHDLMFADYATMERSK